MVQEVMICDVDIMYFYSIINRTLFDPHWRASPADMWAHHDNTSQHHDNRQHTNNARRRPRERLPGSLGRPIVGAGSLGRRPSGYAAPGGAVAAPVRARSSPGGHTLQHLPKASRRRKLQTVPCRPRGAVPRVIALQGVAVDVPARKVG